jgi:hypothetical protein
MTACSGGRKHRAGRPADGCATCSRADDNPYPMRALAAQLRAIGDQGYALAEKALRVAEEEADRKR